MRDSGKKNEEILEHVFESVNDHTNIIGE